MVAMGLKGALPFDADRLDQYMSDEDIDLIVMNSKHNIQYMLGGYRFFFFEVMDGIGVSRYLPIYIYPRGRPDEAIYIAAKNEADAMRMHAASWPDLRLPETLFASRRVEDALSTAIDCLRQLGVEGKRIGIEGHFLPSMAKDMLVEAFPAQRIGSADRAMERLRAIKSPSELDLIRLSCEKVVESMVSVFSNLSPGMRTDEVYERLREAETTRGLLFEYCLVAAGRSHSRAPSPQILKAGDVISLDSGGTYKGYIGDLCRMGVLGEPDGELIDLLGEVDRIQQVARAQVVPGNIGREICRAGAAAAAMSNHAGHIEFLAHGVGLINHESPRLMAGPIPYPSSDADAPLEPGMVLSIETTLKHPLRGYIKLEDTLAVTKTGAEAFGDRARLWN